MKTFLICAGVAAVLAACAVVKTGDDVWYKEGATAREREAALAAANAQAMKATEGKPDPGDQTKKQIMVTSMTAQGWRLMHKDSAPSMEPETSRKLPPPGTP
jgi:hypothetical protein